MAKESSQKFIARNRAPRVQIEYDVELYGAEKKIQLPFVMGVLADLSGKPALPLPLVEERKFLDIDIDNFDSRLKAVKPRVAFQVPNKLTGEGNLSVELTFESMDDFSPAAVARKVDALAKLLQARDNLSNLLTYMDGKTGAEELIKKVLKDPALLQSLEAPCPTLNWLLPRPLGRLYSKAMNFLPCCKRNSGPRARNQRARWNWRYARWPPRRCPKPN